MSRQPKATRQRNAESSELRNYTDAFVNFPSTFWDNLRPGSLRVSTTTTNDTLRAISRGADKRTKMCRPIPK